MPTPKQMEKLAAESATSAAPDTEALPAGYWKSLLHDPRAADSGLQVLHRSLSEIQRHVLRVSCRRCERTVEIQTVDAIRLYGRKAIWKQVGQQLLDDTCRQRTGSQEDDGCWPNFDP